ncbi:hypothetical protein RCL_jg18479.t1 [Rhizophagus clarus]|uniref:Uncharacterized protein n=1 Tax=Rhizophagus clarus TaxID=94130 RepID=A0A8H3LGU2_9GLOM|nr:hypothetical protein RCL_jg18479.t1 [Rhizophagus clarus]
MLLNYYPELSLYLMRVELEFSMGILVLLTQRLVLVLLYIPHLHLQLARSIQTNWISLCLPLVRFGSIWATEVPAIFLIAAVIIRFWYSWIFSCVLKNSNVRKKYSINSLFKIRIFIISSKVSYPYILHVEHNPPRSSRFFQYYTTRTINSGIFFRLKNSALSRPKFILKKIKV